MARRKPRIYTVAMTKGGQTKTTQALGLAVILAEANQPVVVFDTDQTNTNMTKFLRKRRASLKEREDESEIPFYQVNSSDELQKMVKKEFEAGNNCVIDCAPTTDAATIFSMLLADVILLPVRQGAIEADALERLGPILQAVVISAKKAGVKPPQVFSLLAAYKNTLTGRENRAQIEALEGVTFLGEVFQTEAIGRCIREGFAFWEVHPNRDRANEYRDLLARAVGKGF